MELQGKAFHHALNVRKDMEVRDCAKNAQEIHTVMEQQHAKSNMQIALKLIMWLEHVRNAMQDKAFVTQGEKDVKHAQQIHGAMGQLNAKKALRNALSVITQWSTVCNVKLDMSLAMSLESVMNAQMAHSVLDSLAHQTVKFPIAPNIGPHKTSAKNVMAI